MASAKIFRINYKSDFILTLTSDAGWMTPFCIKFWTGSPMLAYYASWDGETYTHCAPVAGEPTKLLVQFDDHHLPIGDLKFQIAYHFTVADFPNDTEDEVLNQANITTEIDGEEYQVMLDFTGETAPEIEFSLPAYANEAQRIANEQQRIANEQTRIQNEKARIAAEATRQQNEQQRINQEQARVNEYASLKADAVAATVAANDAAALANQKAQLAADKAALAQAASYLANAKAQLAADKAALADAAATLANQKAALAQQKAEYAQEQGTYSKNQGDYAKEQGDYSKAQGDYAKEQGDYAKRKGDDAAAQMQQQAQAFSEAQAARQTSYEQAEGTESGSVAGDGSRWGAFKTNEAARDAKVDAKVADITNLQEAVAEGAVYDVSAKNPTAGPNNDGKWGSLSALLSDANLNTLIPSAVRRGGMSIKFVLSSDNKYLSFIYTNPDAATNSKFTDVANWQKIVAEEEISTIKFNYGNTTALPIAMSYGYIRCNGEAGTTADLTPVSHSTYKYAVVACVPGDVFYIIGKGGNSDRLYCFATSDNTIIGSPRASSNQNQQTYLRVVAPSNSAKIILNDESGIAVSYHGEKSFIANSDDMPTANSNNLVKSGGVNKDIVSLGNQCYSPNSVISLDLKPSFSLMGIQYGEQGDYRAFARFDWKNYKSFTISIPNGWYISVQYYNENWEIQTNTGWTDDRTFTIDKYTNIQISLKDSSDAYHHITDNAFWNLTVTSNNILYKYVPAARYDDVENLKKLTNWFVSVDLSKLTAYHGSLTNSNWNGTNRAMRHKVIPVSKGDIVSINASSETAITGSYGWLTDGYIPPTTGSAIPYVSNTSRIDVTFGETKEVVAPENASYLCLTVVDGASNNVNWTVAVLKFNSILNRAITLVTEGNQLIKNYVDVIQNGLIKHIESGDNLELELGTVAPNGTNGTSTHCVRTPNDKRIPMIELSLAIEGVLSLAQDIDSSISQVKSNIHCYDSLGVSLGRTGFIDVTNKVHVFTLFQNTAYIRICFAFFNSSEQGVDISSSVENIQNISRNMIVTPVDSGVQQILNGIAITEGKLDAIVAEKFPSEKTYIGEKIIITNGYNLVDYGSYPNGVNPTQGMAIHGNYCVQGSSTESNGKTMAALINMQTRTKIADILLAHDNYSPIHCNIMCFGNETAPDGVMPLVYASQWNYETCCFVYDIQLNGTSTLKQVISPANLTRDNIKFGIGYVDWVVDTDHNWLFAISYTSNTYSSGEQIVTKFPLPKLSDGALVELSDADIIGYNNIGGYIVRQDGCYNGNKLYLSYGDRQTEYVPYLALHVIDVFSLNEVSTIDLQYIAAEPEGIDVYNGNLVFHTQNADTLKRFVF